MFFLSDVESRQKPKYILASSLGVPMLHAKWLEEIEQRYRRDGVAKVFDSELYSKYRLPVGLDIAAGVFSLQRASNARNWMRPGFHYNGNLKKTEGKAVFDGMRIGLALEEGAANDW